MSKSLRRMIGLAMAVLMLLPAVGALGTVVATAGEQVHQITTWQQVNGASASIWLAFSDGDTLDFSAVPDMDTAAQLVIPASVTNITLAGDSELVSAPFSLRAMGAVNVTLHDFHFQTPATGNVIGIAFVAGTQNQINLVGTNSIASRGGAHGITGDVAFYGSGTLTITASAAANGAVGGRNWSTNQTRADGTTGGVGQTGGSGVVGTVHFNHTGNITITGGRGGNGGRGGHGFGSNAGGSGNGGHGGRGGHGGSGILGDVFGTGSGTVSVTGGNGGTGGDGGDGMSPAGLVGGGGRGGNGGNGGNGVPAINGNVVIDGGYRLFLTGGIAGWNGFRGRPTTSAVNGELGTTTGISASPSAPSFGSHLEGYSMRPLQTITITNRENRSITLDPLPNIPNWTLVESVNWSTPFALGESRTFSVRPSTDLAPGTYNPPIIITGNGVSTMIRPVFQVLFAAMEISPTELDFGTHLHDFEQIPEQTVTVHNNGTSNVTLNALPVVEYWALTPGANWSVAILPGSSRTFTIAPNPGMLLGTHSPAIMLTASGGLSAQIQPAVTITPVLATGVSIQGAATQRMNIDQTLQLTATVSPASTYDQQVFWESGNEDVAVVNENGLVTSISYGTAEIFATTNDGGHVAIVNVMVQQVMHATTPVGGTFYDLAGINWRVLHEDALGRRLVITTHVHGRNAPGGTWAGVRFHSANSFLQLRNAEINSRLTAFHGHMGADMRAIAVAVDLGTDHRTTTVARPNAETNPPADAGPGDVGFSQPGFGVPTAANTMHILTLAEVNHYLGTTNAERIGRRHDTNAAIWWWTRSPGTSASTVTMISNSGAPANENPTSQTASDGFRPALWIAPTALPAQSISIQGPATLTLGRLDTHQLQAAVMPAGSNQAVTWTSNNPAVATVNADGLVTATLTTGSATITATTAESGFTASVTVTVEAAHATTPVGGTFLDAAGIRWRVLHIDQYGRRLVMTEHVMGNGAPHDAFVFRPFHSTNSFVQLRSAGINTRLTSFHGQMGADMRAMALPVDLGRDHRTSTVARPAAETSPPATAGPGDVGFSSPGHGLSNSTNTMHILTFAEVNRYLGTTNAARIARCIDNTARRWWTRSPGTATASPMTTISTDGAVNISAANSDLFGFRPAIWINPAPFNASSVSIAGNSTRYVLQGNTIELTATLPAGALPGIGWSSNNSAVATVNASGLVTAVAGGSAVITATATNGGAQASVTINVMVNHANVGRTFYDAAGINWTVLHVDNDGNHLVVTTHVYGNNAPDATFAGRRFHSVNSFVQLRNAEINARLTTFHGQMGFEMRAHALAVDLGTDHRTTLISRLDRERNPPANDGPGSIGFSSASNNGPTSGNTMFILTLAEVNRYFGTTDAARLARCRGNTARQWWTRSPGHDTNITIAIIQNDGGATTSSNATGTAQGFRPAVWISDFANGVTIEGAATHTLSTANPTVQLTAMPTPGLPRTVMWSTSDPAVATVSATGLVQAVNLGTTTITATTTEGGFTASVQVNVIVPVTGVSMVGGTGQRVMTNGSTLQLVPNITPANATNQDVTWQSANTAIASVSANGLVTAHALGTTNITVRTDCGNRTATVSVRVDPSAPNVPVTGVTILGESIVSLDIGQTRNLLHTIAPANATNQAVVWSSANHAVATVSATGQVTAVGAGSTTITVTTMDGSRTASVTVQVAGIPVTGVSIPGGNRSLSVGQQAQLSAIVAPANATNQAVVWSSANHAIATVSATGQVTAVGAGSTTITVTTVDGSRTDTITVQVTGIAVTGVSIPGGNRSLSIGQQAQLSAIIAPANASNQAVTWSSNNTAVATVSPSGQVLAMNNGNATITVTTADGSLTASVTVTVASSVVLVESVSIPGGSRTLMPGQQAQLTAIITPANATNHAVVWESNNPARVQVNANGLVTAVSAGSATITATTLCGGRQAAVVVTVSPNVLVASVSIHGAATRTIIVGQQYRLMASVAPANANNQLIHWHSDNPGVAIVNANGLVAASSAGEAVITATTACGNRIAQVTLNVQTPRIFSTNWEANFFNWLLFFLGFGWIWMWF